MALPSDPRARHGGSPRSELREGSTTRFLGWASIAGLLLSILTAGCRQSPQVDRLVIVSLDTLRRDHLGLYGYPRPTSPELDRLAAASAVFEEAFTQDVNTNPAHATLFTGLYPHEHGNRVNGHLLRRDVPVLAELLSHAGFATGAFVGGAPMKAEASGLDRGFGTYDDRFAGRRRDGRETTARALAWWSDLPPRKPAFLFLHLWDAHGPYEPDPEELAPFRRQARGPRLDRIPEYQRIEDDGEPLGHLFPFVDRYDALIRRLDGLVGRVEDALDPQRTLLVVLSDHGETLGERYHPLDHGAQLWDEQIRVPLLLKGAGVPPGRYEGFVELVDLVPTLLGHLGVQSPPTRGRDLGPLLRGANVAPRDHVFGAARADSGRYGDRGYRLDVMRRIFSVRSEGWKLIAYPAREGEIFELYDLRADPGETRDVASENRAKARELLRILEAWNGDRSRPIATIGVSDELREQLRSLGYLD